MAAAPALLAPLAAVAVGENKVGYACRGSDDCGVDKAAIARLTATPGSGSAAGVRFGGTYTDPQHPGCTRKVVLTGSNVVITGADEPGGKEWKVKGKPYGRALLIDFTPKGGPPDVIARWTGLGLEFPDGNEHEVLALIDRSDLAVSNPVAYDPQKFYALADPSGTIHIRSANSGASGASGSLVFANPASILWKEPK